MVLRTGPGHEEMNMIRSFAEMYWEIIYSEFGKTQGFVTEKAQLFFKRCGDHHQSFDNFCKFHEAIYQELLWPYTCESQVPSPYDFWNG